jgi:hypothetical protein
MFTDILGVIRNWFNLALSKLGIKPGHYIEFEMAAIDGYQGYEEVPDRIPMAAMMEGSFSINQPLYVGEVGNHFYNTWTALTGGIAPIVYNCIEYDSNYLIAHSLEHALQLGQDFEEPDILHQAIR